jgi:DNA adenine methylase
MFGIGATLGEQQATTEGKVPGRPFLRWAGSKRKIIPRLEPFWTEGYSRYVEPFAGSACLFFALGPKKGLLGDSNGELINVYRQLRKNPKRIHHRLVHIPRESDAFYRWRAKDPAQLDAETRALRFLFLNHNCFNGIYRTNVQGQFNVPFGTKLSRYLTLDEFLKCAKALEGVQFVSGDFEKTLSKVTTGDFVYLDPPYAVTARRVFTEYGKKAFAVDDVARLSTQLDRMNSVGAHFVVSYADCREARELSRSWNSKKFSVRRHIAGFSEHRAQAYEWIISNLPVS